MYVYGIAAAIVGGYVARLRDEAAIIFRWASVWVRNLGKLCPTSQRFQG
jgi:hypothetical protein